MKKRLLLASLLFAACGGKSSESTVTTTSGTGASANNLPVQETTLAAVGLDPAAINRDVNPCDDFYQFACGGWLASTEIPADKARYGRFNQIHERNEAALHAILEEAREGKLESPVAEPIGTFYSACMNEEAIEKAGTAPIESLLKVAASVRRPKDLDAAIAKLHAAGVSVAFHFASTPDYKDATKMIGEMMQGGLGLPDRDYYIKEDDRNVAIRKTYQEHVQAMLTLAGMKDKEAKQAALDVLAIETEFAKNSMPREERRDPENVYHKIDREGVAKLAPNMDWNAYFQIAGIPDIVEINVDNEDFFKSLNAMKESVKPTAWKNYLTWQVVDSTASLLPKAFVDQNFKMSQFLSGAQELPPRWKRCVASTDHALGELLAQPYLERMFGPNAKQGADNMVVGITQAFASVLSDIDWMSPETKERAMAKLEAMSPMFGYPDKWLNYTWNVTDSYAGNALASRNFERNRDLQKIDKPYDRSEWFMSPPTTNAYYNPQANQMVFPAGILQPPFYSEEAHTPVNLGAMGMIVGHELTHGFDDSGAKFDGDGNMVNWWSDADLAQFQERGQCVVDQYAHYEPVEGAKLNGKLTLGENIADLGGVKLAFMAYRKMMEGADKQLVADGFNEDQQFFLAVGQAWCSKSRDEIARAMVVTDPHSPPEFRVIGSLTNTPEFHEAFSCAEGTPMNPEQMCSVW